MGLQKKPKGREIGGRLSRARIKAGMTIADIAALTRVSSHYLTAIERDEFGCIPSRVHRLGFVRAYARAVDIDEFDLCNTLRQKMDELDQTNDRSLAVPV